MSNIENRVRNIIHEVGVPTGTRGYHYSIEAICIAINNPSILDAIDTELYPQVAKVFQVKSPFVDRHIRYAIENACDRGDLETLQKFFGPTVTDSKSKPSNSEFITRIAEYVKDQEDNA